LRRNWNSSSVFYFSFFCWALLFPHLFAVLSLASRQCRYANYGWQNVGKTVRFSGSPATFSPISTISPPPPGRIINISSHVTQINKGLFSPRRFNLKWFGSVVRFQWVSLFRFFCLVIILCFSSFRGIFSMQLKNGRYLKCCLI